MLHSALKTTWNRLGQALGGSRAAADADAAQLWSFGRWPAAVYAIGDIHGRLDLLVEIERLIALDARSIEGEVWMIPLGDYVDRGPDSAAVLDHLLRPPPPRFRRWCLAGNHERMMLRHFRGEPSYNWLDAGGFETLRSYGAAADRIEETRGNPRRLRHLVESHVPEEHIAFLLSLPARIDLPGFSFAHMPPPGRDDEREAAEQAMAADLGLDPGPPMERGVHGHRIVEQVAVKRGIANLDTGAYFTGRLSALRLSASGSAKFLQTAGNGSAPHNPRRPSR